MNRWRKVTVEPEGKGAERILILCVDRDDDIGVKAKVKTPILGREENLKAAVSLALQVPEEAGANALFEAVKIYDGLKDKVGEDHQIATIAGSELRGVEADRKLVAELTTVLKNFPANGVVLVTDGFTEETVLPLVRSRVPVMSVRRITIKHSNAIEETAAVFSRYLKMLVENPRYSRIVLGLPGILTIVFGILWYFNQLFYAGVAFLVIIGSFLFVKGFGFDRKIRALYEGIRRYSPPPLEKQIVGFSTVAGVLLIGVGCYYSGAAVANYLSTLPDPPTDFGQWLTLLPILLGLFITKAITLIVIGICVMLSGGVIRWFLERDTRFWRTLVVMVVTAWSQQIIYQAAQILINPGRPYDELVFTIIIGILLAAASSLVTHLLHLRYAHLFKEKESEVAELKKS